MRYEHKILIGDPKGKRLLGRLGGRLENNIITGLGCPAYHIHCVITPVRVYEVCARVTAETLNVANRSGCKYSCLCCVLDVVLRSKWRQTIG